MRKCGRWFVGAVLGGLLLAWGGGGCERQEEDSAVGGQWSSSAAEPISARLERIGILVGTPGEKTQQMAEMLAAALTGELQLPCEVIAYGAPMRRFDSQREWLLWLGRGTVAAGRERSLGKPIYVLHSADSRSFWRVMVDGLVPPALEFRFSGTQVVDRETRRHLNKAAAAFAAGLARLLQPCRRPDSVVSPPVELMPQTPPVLRSDRLRNWRKIAEMQGLGQAFKSIYSFDCSTPDADWAALGELLAPLGYSPLPVRGSDAEGYWSFQADSTRNLRDIVCFYHRPGAGKAVGGTAAGQLDQALVVVYGEASGARDPAALWTELKKNAVRTLALSCGLPRVKDPAERRELADRFFSLPQLSVKERLAVLGTLARDPVCRTIFLREAGQLCAGLSGMAPREQVEAFGRLWRYGESYPELRRKLAESVPGKYQELALPYAKDAPGGVALGKYSIPVGNLKKFTRFLVLTDPGGEYRPYLLPLAIEPEGDDTYRMTAGTSFVGPLDFDRWQNFLGLRSASSTKPEALELAIQGGFPFAGDSLKRRGMRVGISLRTNPERQSLELQIRRVVSPGACDELARLRERYRQAGEESRPELRQEMERQLEKLRGRHDYVTEAMKLRELDSRLADRVVHPVAATAAPDARGVRHTALSLPMDMKQGRQLVFEFIPDPVGGARLLFPVSVLPLSERMTFSAQIGDQVYGALPESMLQQDAWFFNYVRKKTGLWQKAMMLRERKLMSRLPWDTMAPGDLQLRCMLEPAAGKIRLDIWDRSAVR